MQELSAKQAEELDNFGNLGGNQSMSIMSNE